MVKRAHNVTVSVFCEPGDQMEMLEGLHTLAPLDFEEEKIHVEQDKATGLTGNTIVILKLVLEKDRHINPFLDNLYGHLTEEQRLTLRKQAESRVDEENNFFLRLEKDRLLDEEWELTDGGNCFHIRINPAVFPKRRQNVIAWVNETFK